jgi:uncharacterized membrane protein YfcA
MDPLGWAAVAAAFVVAGGVKGLLGLGLPTVSLALLSLFLPLGEAVRLMLLPSLLTNLWQGTAGGHLAALLRRLWGMLAALTVGTWLGAGLLPAEHASAAKTLLGVVLCAYAALGLRVVAFRVPRRAEAVAGPAVGLATGVIAGMTGSFVLPSVPYLNALGLGRDALVQAMGVTFSVATLALMAVFGLGSGLGAAAMTASVLALAPAVLGMWAGGWLRPRISAAMFRRATFLCLFALGVHLAVSSWL